MRRHLASGWSPTASTTSASSTSSSFLVVRAVAQDAEVAGHAAVGVDRDAGQDLLALVEAEPLHVEVGQADPVRGVVGVLAVVGVDRDLEGLEVLGDLRGVGHRSGAQGTARGSRDELLDRRRRRRRGARPRAAPRRAIASSSWSSAGARGRGAASSCGRGRARSARRASPPGSIGAPSARGDRRRLVDRALEEHAPARVRADRRRSARPRPPSAAPAAFSRTSLLHSTSASLSSTFAGISAARSDVHERARRRRAAAPARCGTPGSCGRCGRARSRSAPMRIEPATAASPKRSRSAVEVLEAVEQRDDEPAARARTRSSAASSAGAFVATTSTSTGSSSSPTARGCAVELAEPARSRPRSPSLRDRAPRSPRARRP